MGEKKMTKKFEIYKCEICGNVVSVVDEGAGTLVCCEQDMKLLEAKTGEEEGKEKHVPVVEISEGKITVKVGSVPHPMEEKHFIGLIQLVKDGKVIVGKRLSSTDEPQAEFCLDDTEGVTAQIWCNLHGVWKS